MSFNYMNNLTLGGLMGASPYSNLPIINAAFTNQRQQQRNYTHRPRYATPTGVSAFHNPTKQEVSTPVIKFRLPDHVIQDVLCRFIMNIPEEEKFDPVRALFQVELAHWFFIDHYCADEGDPSLAGFGHIPFNQFAYIMFKEAPHLRQYYANVDKYLADFRSYRSRVPTYGAILMNQELTQVVLVQGFRNSWGFPKGKVNETEDPVECAIREVYEETGYDMRSLINPNHFIESKTQDRNDRLYLIRGVDPNFAFSPQTQYEIKQIAWFNIDEIPEHKKDTNPKILAHGQATSYFFTIFPYMRRLKLWMADKLEGKNKVPCFRSKYFASNGEDDEQYVDETYDTPKTPSSYSANASSSSIKTVIPQSGEEFIRNALAGMTISSSSSKNNNITTRGKSGKSKKRLFSENEGSVVESQFQGKNVQEAASLLSNAMGIPVNIKNSPRTTTEATKVSQRNSTTTTKNNYASVQIPMQRCFGHRKFPFIENINITPNAWRNFEFDKQKVLKALQMNYSDTPPP